MHEDDDLYEILQVHQSAEQEVIEATYRRLARMYHPDVNTSPDATEVMKRLNYAYEILHDPHRRAKYDGQRTKRISAAPANRRSYVSA
jgi:curved DNA-binding protein